MTSDNKQTTQIPNMAVERGGQLTEEDKEERARFLANAPKPKPVFPQFVVVYGCDG